MVTVMNRLRVLKKLPGMVSVLATMMLIYVAYVSERNEIILPTFGALCTGAWIVPENLWHYHKINLIVSLPLAATVGLLISLLIGNMEYIAVYPSLYVGFLAAACILIFGRTQIYPCFGAMTLPILLRTTSWLYPLSVFLIAVTLVIVQRLLEMAGARAPLTQGEFPEHRQHRRERFIYYIQTSLGLIPALVLVAWSENHWFLLPPLFVTYATFCNAKSAFVRYPVQTWGQLILAAGLGNFAFWLALLANQYVASYFAPVIVAAMAGGAVFITIGLGRVFHRLFPPAVSLVITPFLIQFHPLLPLYVAVTSAYLILAAWAMRTHPAYRGKDLRYL